MIAGVSDQTDIELFVQPEEINALETSVLSGVLVKTASPKRQGIVCLSVDDTRRVDGGFGVGVDGEKYFGVTDGFRIDVFMSSDSYSSLRQRGVVSRRHALRSGSKITIYDISQLSADDKTRCEYLEFYRDNKDALKDSLA